MNNIPTPEQGIAFERFHSYRCGWTDAASGKWQRDPKFASHATRPDIPEAYRKGFEDGERARNEAMRAGCAAYDYVPNPLRSAEPAGSKGAVQKPGPALGPAGER